LTITKFFIPACATRYTRSKRAAPAIVLCDFKVSRAVVIGRLLGLAFFACSIEELAATVDDDQSGRTEL
jgi:hypothetical protein